ARNERPPGRRDSASAHKERPQPGTPPAPTAPPAPPPSTTPVPANSYLCAELVRCTLRARHPATSRRTGHSPPDPPGAPGTRRPHPAPRPSRELVPASRTRTVHATSSAHRYESAHPVVRAGRRDRRTARPHAALTARTRRLPPRDRRPALVRPGPPRTEPPTGPPGGRERHPAAAAR